MSLSFLVFADLHYKEGMYASTVADLQAVLSRAAATHADFVLHAGDFCNDYPGSPEVVDLLMQNPHNLAVYGCYGNHELETAGTAMQFVTPKLTNREVVWGTPDGKIGDGSIGYYHFDHGAYRVVMTDTNYSQNAEGHWEHNRTGSYNAAPGNSHAHSLGPTQLCWLEQTLYDAARHQLQCIVVSHAALNSRPGACPDAALARDIFARANARHAGTVLLAINGHYHTDGCKTQDGVIYFDVNATRNAWWAPMPHGKYGEDTPTFPYIAYDIDGRPMEAVTERPLSTLRQGSRTLFTEAPLSAIVTVKNRTVTIKGTASRWVADLAPDTDREEIKPLICDRVVTQI